MEARFFSFMDLAFPLVRDHAIKFCKEIIERGYAKKFRWSTECRVKPLDEELPMLMKKAGCVRVCFGIESGDDKILKALKKNFIVEDVRNAVKFAHKVNLQVDGMFMIGLPGETEGTINKTIEFAIELKLRYAIFNLFVPVAVPGVDPKILNPSLSWSNKSLYYDGTKKLAKLQKKDPVHYSYKICFIKAVFLLIN